MILAKLEKFNQGDWNELTKIQNYMKKLGTRTETRKTRTNRYFQPYPKKIHDYVLKRSHGKCEFQLQQKYEHMHHTNRLASNKIHDPDQIIALCEAHHDLAHRGLIDNEEFEPTTWKIQKHPDYTNLNWYVDEKVQFYRRK